MSKRKKTAAELRNRRIRFEVTGLNNKDALKQGPDLVMISATTPFIASYDALQRLLSPRRKK